MKTVLLIKPHAGLRTELGPFLRHIEPQPALLEADSAEEALRVLKERISLDHALLDDACTREALCSVLLLQQSCRSVQVVLFADPVQPGCVAILAMVAGASAGTRLGTMLSLLCGDGRSNFSEDHDGMLADAANRPAIGAGITAHRLRARMQRAGLTLREQQVLSHAIEGAPYKSIAEALLIAEQTVRHHMSRCLRKLGVKTREQVIVLLAHER